MAAPLHVEHHVTPPPVRRHLALVVPAARVPPSRRSVRARRLVLGVFVAALIALGTVLPTLRSGPARAPVPVTVAPGDTLWSVAEAHGPAGRDVREVVAEMRQRNHLTSTVLQPGQVLLVP